MASGGSMAAVESALRVIRNNPQGITHAALESALPGVPLEDLAGAINSILQAGSAQLFQMEDGGLMYRAVSAEQAAQFRGLSTEDMLVYQTIKEASTKGIWSQDIKRRTNLHLQQYNKSIKTLENKKLIKSIKAATGGNKKTYILAHLEPDIEVTGGPMRINGQLDTGLISALRELCLTHIVTQGMDTLEGVVEAVRRAGSAGRTNLTLENYKQVIGSLVFDNELEATRDASTGKVVYRPCRNRVPEMTALTSIPCGVCPVVAECVDGGIISPQTCIYYGEWLQGTNPEKREKDPEGLTW